MLWVVPVQGGGLAQGNVVFFAFGGAYWPLATAKGGGAGFFAVVNSRCKISEAFCKHTLTTADIKSLKLFLDGS